MEELQIKINKFLDERKWHGLTTTHDTMLNIVEEVGELWNYFKYIGNNEKEMEKVLKNHYRNIEDQIGDMGWLLLKLCGNFDMDLREAIWKSHKEYEERFPLQKAKKSHANLKAGGIDLKYQNKKNKSQKPNNK